MRKQNQEKERERERELKKGGVGEEKKIIPKEKFPKQNTSKPPTPETQAHQMPVPRRWRTWISCLFPWCLGHTNIAKVPPNLSVGLLVPRVGKEAVLFWWRRRWQRGASLLDTVGLGRSPPPQAAHTLSVSCYTPACSMLKETSGCLWLSRMSVTHVDG